MSHVAHDIKSRSIRCPNWNADCKVRTKFRLYFPRPPGGRGGRSSEPSIEGDFGRATDGAYQKLRKKSPRCVVPGGLLRNPSRRNKSGKILETWFGKPSDSQAARSMLSSPDAKMKKKKLLRDALLPTGLLQHDNGRNTVNPGEPIHPKTALRS